jgi:RNA polymerase sigma-70 factor (ECF subfamily)
MDSASSALLTQLLRAWSEGEERAMEQLMPLVYEELRRKARGFMWRENKGNSMQATALVNEVYLQMIDAATVRWQDRAHFFAMAAQMMRRILVDAARARGSTKRGGEYRKVAIEGDRIADRGGDPELMALDEALDALARKDPRKAKVVELRFFGGLSLKETAQVLKVSEDTVGRDWNFAKAWLAHEIR